MEMVKGQIQIAKEKSLPKKMAKRFENRRNNVRKGQQAKKDHLYGSYLFNAILLMHLAS